MLTLKHKFLIFVWNGLWMSNSSLCSWKILVPRTSQERPPPTFPGRTLNVLFGHSEDVLKWCLGDVLIWLSRDVPGRLIQDVPKTLLGHSQTSPRGRSKQILGTLWGHLSDVSKFLFTFLSELIRLTKYI